jgi:hypothetical protein
MHFQNLIRRAVLKTIVTFVVVLFAVDGFAIDPANPPQFMRGTVTYNGQIRTFNLDRYDIRGANFEVVLLDTDGITKLPIDAGPVRTYRGWCEEETDSYVEANCCPMATCDIMYSKAMQRNGGLIRLLKPAKPPRRSALH